ncbi:hypothetical protein GCM10010254_43650 [Streptomyces chromofuscus]|nr:hypothetical protein GCM10010254_43650 [Streptomyces chromofuscus]
MCTERRWYLVAWDLDRDDWRTFRVDRITPKPPHGPRCAPRTPPAEDLAAYVSQGVSTRAYATRAVVRLLVPLAEAAERVSPSDGTLEPDGDDACVLRTGAASLDVMVLHVMLLGLEFEVLEPAELTEAITVARDRLSRALRRGVPEWRDARRTPGGVRSHVGAAVASRAVDLDVPGTDARAAPGATNDGARGFCAENVYFLCACVAVPGPFGIGRKRRPGAFGREVLGRAIHGATAPRENCVRVRPQGGRNRPSV